MQAATPINADAWYGSQGSGYAIPGYGQMTDRVPDFPTGSHRDANGKLWNEWGSMNKYATGWYSGNYWVKELTTEGNARHYVYLGNGNLFSFPIRWLNVCHVFGFSLMMAFLFSF